jgi:tetratricopeptide (TPR) repeat protein
MEAIRPRVRDELPYPIAYPYALIFAEQGPNGEPLSWADRRWALCFTEYQLLRVVCLALVGQYLREEIDATRKAAVEKLKGAVARLRSPFFSDWISVLNTLAERLPQVGITPCLPGLAEALRRLDTPAERLFLDRDNRPLPPLDAIRALRNATAHGGLIRDDEARQHVEGYLPVLHQVLDAFDFLADCTLQTCANPGDDRPEVRVLRGHQPPPAAAGPLDDDRFLAFGEAPAILCRPWGAPVPLYPLLRPDPAREPLLLYDGHYGIRVGDRGQSGSAYLYYLGVYDREKDPGPVARLRELLAARHISYDLPKEDVAPWTIADSAADYTQGTLTSLFADLDRVFERFLQLPPSSLVCGFLLAGAAGSGKTAFLAHHVARLTRAGERLSQRENPNLVLFLRGNGLYPREHGEVSLFRDVAEKLGAAVGGKGVGSFAELFDQLHKGWAKDKVAGRRFLLVLDAVNEAPFPEKVLREALEVVQLAGRYTWCKVVISTRQEYVGVLHGKLDANAKDPIEQARRHLFDPHEERPDGQRRPPLVTVEPTTPEQAGQIYERYRQQAPRLPACATPWAELTGPTRELLLNPLHLHLFMELCAGRMAQEVTTAAELFRRYVDRAVAEQPGLRGAIHDAIGSLLEDVARPSADLTDDDVLAIRGRWERVREPGAVRLGLNPVEALVHEGWVSKRVREEGGGYRFVFQALAEYLVYFCLRDEKPAAEPEQGYWQRHGQPGKVFPEYSGAFGRLLRDWEARAEGREWIGPLIAAGGQWLQGVLSGLLVELAQVDFVPWSPTPRAERLAGVLQQTAHPAVAEALYQAGHVLCDAREAPSAVAYFRVCAAIRERLDTEDARHVGVADGLALALNALGFMLRAAGGPGEAEGYYRRAVAISERRYAEDPHRAGVADFLAVALNNLGNLLRAAGESGEAEDCYRRAVVVSEGLYAEDPRRVGVADGLAMALANLGILLRAVGRPGEAEKCYRRAIEVSERSFAEDPRREGVTDVLALALNNLGNLLRAASRPGEAEDCFRRAVAVYERQLALDPRQLGFANNLAVALTNLGVLLRGAGRPSEADDCFRRAFLIREPLYRANRGNVDLTLGYAVSLAMVGRRDEAEELVAEVLTAQPRHPYANQLKRSFRRAKRGDSSPSP